MTVCISIVRLKEGARCCYPADVRVVVSATEEECYRDLAVWVMHTPDKLPQQVMDAMARDPDVIACAVETQEL